ncbi:hypothetical protein CP532_5856 [Ophiocordyceps camponoti-leonardi (nom. inval.)]|nr:hypothetical protein CP532_5856 [Ophiocordyceps camponoti-leonardi (nom. inval.)]
MISNPLLLGCLILLLLQAALPVLAPEPKAARWHGKPIGPDGPWNAVEVTIGRHQTPVALFPGRAGLTWVITTDYCLLNGSISHCPGGAYQKENSMAERSNLFKITGSAQVIMRGFVVEGPSVTRSHDDFYMGFVSGLVPNVSMDLVDSQMMVYPGGGRYPVFAGCLNLGAADGNWSYAISPTDLINSPTIPCSFGMHIGSAVPGSTVGGSLLYGGYDRSRVVGKVLELDGQYEDGVKVTDISIRVVQGKSPFDFRARDRLVLAEDGTRPAAGITVNIDPCSPYLTLPRTTCGFIAANLPVTYSESLGLYIWNTDDSNFTLTNGAESLTINIPFQHLNLTLDPPLATKSAPYFPCSNGGIKLSGGSYVLGRAFFQDAFLGANWEQRRWWLAQAPGPSSTASPNPTDILPGDKTIRSSDSDWVSTWSGVWAELAGNRSGGPSATQQPDAGSGSLSTGAKVGIGVGAGLGVLALILGALGLWRRKARQPRTAVHSQLQQQQKHFAALFQGSMKGSVNANEGPGENKTESQFPTLDDIDQAASILLKMAVGLRTMILAHGNVTAAQQYWLADVPRAEF